MLFLKIIQGEGCKEMNTQQIKSTSKWMKSTSAVIWKLRECTSYARKQKLKMWDVSLSGFLAFHTALRKDSILCPAK